MISKLKNQLSILVSYHALLQAVFHEQAQEDFHMNSTTFKIFLVWYNGVFSFKIGLTEQSETATGGVLYEKVFIEISQNSQENTCTRVSFIIKLQASACNFIKKRDPGIGVFL